jgi:hypothetical protein
VLFFGAGFFTADSCCAPNLIGNFAGGADIGLYVCAPVVVVWALAVLLGTGDQPQVLPSLSSAYLVSRRVVADIRSRQRRASFTEAELRNALATSGSK